jgi:hypothetical protein
MHRGESPRDMTQLAQVRTRPHRVPTVRQTQRLFVAARTAQSARSFALEKRGTRSRRLWRRRPSRPRSFRGRRKAGPRPTRSGEVWLTPTRGTRHERGQQHIRRRPRRQHLPSASPSDTRSDPFPPRVCPGWPSHDCDGGRTQGRFQERAENRLQSRAENRLQSRTENWLQGRTENRYQIYPPAYTTEEDRGHGARDVRFEACGGTYGRRFRVLRGGAASSPQSGRTGSRWRRWKCGRHEWWRHGGSAEGDERGLRG